MKPRIRPHPLYRGEWQCGGVRPYDEVIAETPVEAYWLWRWYWERAC